MQYRYNFSSVGAFVRFFRLAVALEGVAGVNGAGKKESEAK